MIDRRTGFRNLDGEVFLRRTCLPLDEVNLDTPQEKGQLDLVADECDCMSGVYLCPDFAPRSTTALEEDGRS